MATCSSASSSASAASAFSVMNGGKTSLISTTTTSAAAATNSGLSSTTTTSSSSSSSLTASTNSACIGGLGIVTNGISLQHKKPTSSAINNNNNYSSSSTTQTCTSNIRIVKTINHTLNNPNPSSSSVSSSSSHSQNPKTLLDSIIRCQTTKLNRFVLNQANSSSNCNSSSKLERNYSYIEAMKQEPAAVGTVKDEKKASSSSSSSSSSADSMTDRMSKLVASLPVSSSSSSPSSTSSSSSSSSSSSTIESCKIGTGSSNAPTVDTSAVVGANEIEIPIEIKLNTTNGHHSTMTTSAKTTTPTLDATAAGNNGSNLAKSRSQSSLINLFKNTFSPFQIRKWRSKSRDKILLTGNNNSSGSNPSTAAHLGGTFGGSNSNSTSCNSSTRSSTSSSSSSCKATTMTMTTTATTTTACSNKASSKRTTLTAVTNCRQQQQQQPPNYSTSNATPTRLKDPHEAITIALCSAAFSNTKPPIPRSNDLKKSPPPPPLPVSTTTVASTGTSGKRNSPPINAQPVVSIFKVPSNSVVDSRTQQQKPVVAMTQPIQVKAEAVTTTTTTIPVVQAPTSDRQLSYLKLTCLLNGYDDCSSSFSSSAESSSNGVNGKLRTTIKVNDSRGTTATTKMVDSSFGTTTTMTKGVECCRAGSSLPSSSTSTSNTNSNEFLKSSQFILNNNERYYDFKLNYLKQQLPSSQTVNAQVKKLEDDEAKKKSSVRRDDNNDEQNKDNKPCKPLAAVGGAELQVLETVKPQPEQSAPQPQPQPPVLTPPLTPKEEKTEKKNEERRKEELTKPTLLSTDDPNLQQQSQQQVSLCAHFLLF
jgi:hypothetical protein